MAEHQVEARILLRYDTLINWMNSSLILKRGEVAIAEATYNYTISSTNDVPDHTPPAIGIKVGDGYHRFYELPWVQGVAGDVYAWAKTATKPTYDASEITNLAEFVAQHSTSTGGGGEVAARLYQIVKGTQSYNKDRYYLQYRTADSNSWTIDTSSYIDVSAFQAVVDWLGNDIYTYSSLGGRTEGHIQEDLSYLDYEDNAIAGYFVTAVSESNGIINVSRKQLAFSDISGTISVQQGGTGLQTLPDEQVLVGHGTGAITGITIDTQVDNNTNLVPNYAIKAYVDQKTAGLTGAMHYIGEATVDINLAINAAVNPQISGYNFANAQAGDVITYNRQELVWTGSSWRLFGDEGSYAIKGSIRDADIDADAAIQPTKIAGLLDLFDQKVDKVPGKQLSTNDYTNDDKTKLANIEAGAQRNLIEHVFVNGLERLPETIEQLPNSIRLDIDVFDPESAAKLNSIETGAQVNAIEHIFVNGTEQTIQTIASRAKSVAINFNIFSTEEKNKLLGIEDNAQVNIIEHIFVNNTEYRPNSDKEVRITIDQAALNLQVLEGAQVPGTINGVWEDVSINASKKLELSRIAKTGNIKDILQSADEYVIINCGSSTTVI